MSDDKQYELMDMVEDFCDAYLNDDYLFLCLELIDEMSERKNPYYEMGNINVWGGAIVYAICYINSAFDETSEVNITRKDIINFFNTKQSVISKKAMNLRNIYQLEHRYTFEAIENWIITTDKDNDNDDDYFTPEGYGKTVEEYQKEIEDYKKSFGEKYFKENEGMFWLIHETRPYMQLLLEQAQLLWETGEKEKAISQYKYMLKLNPNDNQGVRYSLLPNLLELNRLDEAEEVYYEFEDDASANWKFNKLLLDIKSDLPFDEIEKQYNASIKFNPYVIPFLLGNKRIPSELPIFYGFGDENEAVFYYALCADAWYDDDNAMKILEKLSEK